MKPNIRVASVADIPQVFVIELESYKEAWLESAFYDELENEVSHFFVAELEGLIVGFCDIWLYGNIGHLLNIATRRNFRRQGIGAALMEYAIEEAHKLNIETIYLEVRVSNEIAKSLYRKMGLVKIGVEPGYYSDGEDADLMVLKLGPEIRI